MSDMRLLITADLNQGLSVGAINKAIKSIERSNSLKAIRLKVDVDQSILKTLKEFNRSISTINQSMGQQSNINQNVANSIKQSTNAIDRETQALNRQNEALEKNERMKTRVVTSENSMGGKNVRTSVTSGNDIRNKTVSETLMYNSDGGFAGKNDNPTTEVFDHNKLREAENNLQRFTENSSKRLSELRKTIVNLNPDITRLGEELKTLDINSGKHDFSKIDDQLKALESYSKQEVKARKEVNDALKDIGKKASQDEINDINKRAEISQKARLAEYEQQMKLTRSRIQNESAAWDAAYKEKDKLEGYSNSKRTLDTYKSYQEAIRQDEAFNRKKYQNFQKYERMQQDTLNKIETARMKFGQHKGVNATLDGLVFDTRTVKSTEDFSNKLRDINTQTAKTTAGLKAMRVESINFAEGFQTAMVKFPIWMAATTAFYAPLRSLQQGIQHIADLDAALINLKKVTDETAETYSNFLRYANTTANSIGGLTTDIVTATTEWARLGYTIQQSQQLAKQTLVYQNVGDIESAEKASQALISTIKGFGIEVDVQGKNIQKVVDIFNEVGNNYAVSSEGIGEALRRSASALQEGGNTIEQSVALITAANSNIQDPARVGNGLKTIALRIRGVSEEGEDLTYLVPKMEENFNKLGLTLMKDANTFKSTYDILKDLSTVWGDLTDFQRAETLELVAGKWQANVIAAAIKNFADAEGALESALNSTGSAAKENAVYLEGIEAKVKQFQNSVNSFWSSNISSESIKEIVKLGTSLVDLLNDITDSIGGIPLALGLASGAFFKFSKSGQDIFKNIISSTNDFSLKNIFSKELAFPDIDTTKAKRSFSDFNGWVTNSNQKIMREMVQLKRFYENEISYYKNYLPASQMTNSDYKELVKYEQKLADLKKVTGNNIKVNTVLMSALGATTRTATIAATALGRAFVAVGSAIKGVALSMVSMAAYTAIFTGISWAVGKLVSDFNRLRQEQKEFEEAQKQIANSYIDNKEKIQDLLTTYKELSEVTRNGSLFSNIEQEQEYRDLVERISELLPNLVQSIDEKGNKHLKNADAIKEELAYAERLANVEQRQTVLDAESNFKSQIKDIAELNKEIQAIQNTMQFGKVEYKMFSEDIDVVPFTESELNQFEFKILSMQQKVATSSALMRDDLNNLILNILAVNKVSIDDSINDSIKKIVNSLNMTELNETEIVSKGNVIAKLFTEISGLKTVNTVQEAVKLEKSIRSIGIASGLSSGEIDKLIKEANELKEVSKSTTGSTDVLRVSFENMSTELKDSSEEVYELYDAYLELNKGEKLSLDTIIDLTKKYPELIGHLVTENGQLSLNKDGVELLAKAKELEFKNSLEQKKIEVQESQKLLKAKLEVYGGEIEALEKVDKAKFLSNSTSIAQAQYLEQQFDEYQKLKNEINALEALGDVDFSIGTPSKSPKSKSSGSKDDPKLQDATDARINAINAIADAQSKFNEVLESSISSDDTFSTQISKSNELIQGQTKEIDLLAQANVKLLAEQQKLQSANSKYNMSAWIDANGQASESFIELYNSMKSGTAQANLQSLFDQYVKYDSAIKENKTSISSLTKENKELLKSLDEMKLAYTQNYINKRNEELAKYDDELKKSQQRQSIMLQDGANWAKEQQHQIKLMYDKKAALKAENNWIRQRIEQDRTAIASHKLTTAQMKLLTDQLETNSDAWFTNEQAIISATKALNDNREKIVDKIISDYKKMLEQQRDAELQLIDNLMDGEDERHQKVIDNYKKEFDTFKKNIDAQLKAMDRLNATDDYDREINKLTDEKSVIQNKINTIALDDSYEGKAKRKELQEQLEKIQEQIEDKQRDRGRELNRNALNDLLEDRETHLKNIEDAENDQHNKEKKLIEQMKKDKENYYKSILEDEKKYLEIKANLLNQDTEIVKGQLSTLQTEYMNFFNMLTANSETLRKLMGNMLDTVSSNTRTNYDELDKGVPSSSPTTGYNTDKAKDWSEYLLNKKRAEEIKTPSNAEFQKLRARNDELRAKWGFDDGSYEQLKNIRVLHKGGEVDDENSTTQSWLKKILNSDILKPDERFAKVRSGEVMLDDPLGAVKSIASKVMSNISNIIPKSSLTPAALSSGTVIENITINLTGNIQDGADFARKMVNGLNNKGIRVGR